VNFIICLNIHKDVRKESIPVLAFLVFFLCVLAFIMNSAFSMMDEDAGLFRIMFFGVGAFMALVVIFAIFSILRKRPAPAEYVPQKLIDHNYDRPQADHCPVCHANMGTSDKCPECGFKKEWK